MLFNLSKTWASAMLLSTAVLAQVQPQPGASPSGMTAGQKYAERAANRKAAAASVQPQRRVESPDLMECVFSVLPAPPKISALPGTSSQDDHENKP
ncbi:hypothetical protein P7C70_g4100, partial [Phenoliferia sp. Uapishka_3]